jgi:hypothetical protein
VQTPEEHHHIRTFQKEYREFLRKAASTMTKRYVWDCSNALDEARFQRWFVCGRFPGAVPQAEMMKRRWRASLCGLIAPGVASG